MSPCSNCKEFTFHTLFLHKAPRLCAKNCTTTAHLTESYHSLTDNIRNFTPNYSISNTMNRDAFNKHAFIFPLLFLIITTISAQAQEQAAEKIALLNSKLENFYKIDEGVYRSEQPDKADFMALEAFGIEEVLNLRNYHSDNDEAEGTNLKLHRLKTNAYSISQKQLIKALRTIKERKGPIVVHCQHGSDRTGGVLAMYRIVFQNFSKEEAIKEMKEGGFGFHKIFGNIARTIRKADIAHIRRELNLPPGNVQK